MKLGRTQVRSLIHVVKPVSGQRFNDG